MARAGHCRRAAPGVRLAAVQVLVTGGTGFVGSWVVVELLRRGHAVRLLARRPEQVQATFGPHGVDVPDVVVGDVTDPDVVARALEGCEAAVHAAAVFSLDVRDAEEMARTNHRAAELVLRGAVASGLDPVVHVSSTVALVRHGGSSPDLPIGDMAAFPYARTKIESERLARELQQEGHPVVTVYPGAVVGPRDPYRGEQSLRLEWIARGRFPAWPAGAMHYVDVRDVAAVVGAALEPGHGPRRFVVPGHHVDASRLYGTVGRLIGRRRPVVELPAALVPAVLTPVAMLHRVLPRGWRFPADREGAELVVRDTRVDDSPAREELGVTPVPWEDSLRDTISSLVDAGRLPERYRPLDA